MVLGNLVQTLEDTVIPDIPDATGTVCTARNLLSLRANISQWNASVPQITQTEGHIIDRSGAILDSFEALVAIGDSLNDLSQCSPQMAAASREISTILSQASLVGAITSCGLTVTEGAIMLGSQTLQAAHEAYNIRQQNRQLEAQRWEQDRSSTDASRRRGVQCVTTIRESQYTHFYPKANCNSCCTGERYVTTGGYSQCSQGWSHCLLACASQFGQDRPRFTST